MIHRKPLPAGKRDQAWPRRVPAGDRELETAPRKPPRHPDGLDTLRLPPGKAIETHLEHLAEFWKPGTPPHQLATAALAAIKRLTAERNAAWGRLFGGRCRHAFREPAAIGVGHGHDRSEGRGRR